MAADFGTADATSPDFLKFINVAESRGIPRNVAECRGAVAEKARSGASARMRVKA